MTTDAPRFRLPAPLRGVRAAFVFLSRAPVGGFPYRIEDFRWSAAHFPLVGAAVGAASGLVFLLARALGTALAAVLAVGASIVATGAFHEDGLADTADALGGAHGSKRVFDILKDSRIGTYGTVAVVVSVLLRTAAVAQAGDDALWSLIVVHAAARVGPVWLLALMPYVTESASAKGRAVAGARAPQVVVATAWAALWLGAAIALGGLSVAVLALAPVLALSTLASGHIFSRTAGGVTGDFLGAAEQVGECAAWIALLALLAGRAP